MEVVKMSSKGQIVIPIEVRQVLGVGEGSIFAVISADDTVVLRKISAPSKEELIRSLSHFSKHAKQKLQAKGVTEADLRGR